MRLTLWLHVAPHRFGFNRRCEAAILTKWKTWARGSKANVQPLEFLLQRQVTPGCHLLK